MALIKSGGPRDYTYAAVRNIEADKGSGITRVNVGLWYDAEDRNSNITEGNVLPPARDSALHSVAGYNLSLSQIYAALLALPEWMGWSSDVIESNTTGEG